MSRTMKNEKIKHYQTITQLLQESCAGRSGRLMFTQLGSDAPAVDYGRWEQDLLATAGKVQQTGAEHIGIVCDLSYGSILCLYAIMVAGKVAVPLEADQEAAQLEQYIKQADIDLLLYRPERVDGEITGCKAVEVPDFLNTEAQPLPHWPQWEKERNACIFFTSGTEGTPRGVVLTQGNMAHVNSYAASGNLGRPARVLLYLPVHHVFSLLVLTSSIYDGHEIYISRSVKYLARELKEVQPDALTTVPVINDLFRAKIQKGIEDSGKKKDLNRLIKLSNFLWKLGVDLRTPLYNSLKESLGGIPRLIITGGSAITAESIQFFNNIGIEVLQAYGMTETSGSISTNGLGENVLGSVGRPHWFNEVRIQNGEIQVRGSNVMKEYYRDPEATKNAFEDGWLRTGDLGRFDKKGFLYITGRKKNLIILSSGENISPEELERSLAACEAIAEAVVCEKNGRLHADIYPMPNPETDNDTKRKAVAEAVDTLNRRNPLYKRITSWQLREQPFEKTSSLKIRR